MNHFRTSLDRRDLRIGLIASAPGNISLKTCPAGLSQRTEVSCLLSTLSSFQGLLKLSSCSRT